MKVRKKLLHITFLALFFISLIPLMSHAKIGDEDYLEATTIITHSPADKISNDIDISVADLSGGSAASYVETTPRANMWSDNADYWTIQFITDVVGNLYGSIVLTFDVPLASQVSTLYFEHTTDFANLYLYISEQGGVSTVSTTEIHDSTYSLDANNVVDGQIVLQYKLYENSVDANSLNIDELRITFNDYYEEVNVYREDQDLYSSYYYLDFTPLDWQMSCYIDEWADGFILDYVNPSCTWIWDGTDEQWDLSDLSPNVVYRVYFAKSGSANNGKTIKVQYVDGNGDLVSNFLDVKTQIKQISEKHSNITWTDQSGNTSSIVSDELKLEGEGIDTFDGTSSYSDCVISMEIKIESASASGIIARFIDGDNWYFLELDDSNNRIRILKYVDASLSQVASTSVNVVGGVYYYLKFELDGSSLTGYLYYYNVPLATVSGTDANLEAGSVGVRAGYSAKDAYYDDLIVKDNEGYYLLVEDFDDASESTTWESTWTTVYEENIPFEFDQVEFNVTDWSETTVYNNTAHTLTQAEIDAGEITITLPNYYCGGEVWLSFYDMSGIGLDDKIAKVYVDSSRIVGNHYHVSFGVYNLTITDYFDNVLYQDTAESYSKFKDVKLPLYEIVFYNFDKDRSMIVWLSDTGADNDIDYRIPVPPKTPGISWRMYAQSYYYKVVYVDEDNETQTAYDWEQFEVRNTDNEPISFGYDPGYPEPGGGGVSVVTEQISWERVIIVLTFLAVGFLVLRNPEEKKDVTPPGESALYRKD